MKEEHFDALCAYVDHKISFQDFLERYPSNPKTDKNHVNDLLRGTLANHDAVEVEAAIVLGTAFGFTRCCMPLLATLLKEGWHHSHEDIALVFQDLKDPTGINALYDAALAQYDYLSYDDCYALAVKCCWALGGINTIEADEKLRALAKSDSLIKADAARKQLERKDRPPRPVRHSS